MNSRPDKIRLGALYVRESTVEQDNGYSPQKQEKDILEYAKKHGIKIVEKYKDLISGKFADKRADFQRMIRDAEAKKFDAVLVFHSSRFARNVKEARQYKELLRKKLGIEVISVTQDFGNVLEPQGFIGEGINELFDEYYSRQLSFWMKKALTQKRESGFAPGNPPLGYIKKKDDTKNWFVDEGEAKLVKRIFTLYSTGKHSFVNIAEILNKEGHKTKYGNPFTLSSMKGVISNRAYLGYIFSPRKGYPELRGLHKPIISESLWNKTQEVLRERVHAYGRPTAKFRFFLLQGTIYCYGCIKQMKGRDEEVSKRMIPKMYCQAGAGPDGQEYSYYCCKFKKENNSCDQKAIRCEVINSQIIKYLENLVLPEDVINKTLAQIESKFSQYKEESSSTVEISRLEARKKRLNTMFLETETIAPEEYKKQLKEIESQQVVLVKKGGYTTPFKSGKDKVIKDTEKYLRNFKQFWKSDLTPEDRQEWIRITVKRVWVKGNKIVGVEPREEFKPLFLFLEVFGQSPLAAP